MFSQRHPSVACAISFVLCSAPLVSAQGRAGFDTGEYFNVESPQVSPIAHARVGASGPRVLLVCNTPAGVVELWTADDQPVFLDRLRVGLEPISIEVDDATDRFWTANFLGDSVTAGSIVMDGAAPELRLSRTANVGDEPMDIAFDGQSSLFVSLNTTSALAWLDATTLALRVEDPPDEVQDTPTTVDTRFELVQEPPPEGEPPHGLKEPRAVHVRDGRVYAIAFKGGVTHAESTHDLDILSASISGSPTSLTFDLDRSISGLGSTNFNGRFDSAGNLWVVGGDANNMDNEHRSEVADDATGFVESMLYRVQAPGTTSPVVNMRDVNRTKTGAVVNPSAALAMPTDVAVYETGTPLTVTKVFVAAFSSDAIGVFSPNQALPLQNWLRRVVDYDLPAPVGGNTRWGPRGLVLGQNNLGSMRLFVLNRLDNSISVLDPTVQPEVFKGHAAMQDPTPAYIRDGREFLYSADRGNGFVSCASCHTDGRTDGLSWKLGRTPAEGSELFPLEYIFRLFGTGSQDFNGAGQSDPEFLLAMMFAATQTQTANPHFADDKREMVTQSLQGLSNFEVAFHPGDLTDPLAVDHADAVRRLFHNSPFHWRGDKPSLREFNEAFESLLGGEQLTAAEMSRFEEFVHSISYPPNPQQPQDRRFSADVDLPGSGFDFEGGASGLEKFHELPTTLAGRSCVVCHSLPAGTNRRLSVIAFDAPRAGYVEETNKQSIESAALRGLLQKEPLLEPNGNMLDAMGVFWADEDTTPVVAHFGMNHNGILQASTFSNSHTSINSFIDFFFNPTIASADARAVKQFNHEIDWGVAPMVGKVLFVDEDTPVLQALAVVTSMETQARAASAGLVVWGEIDGQRRGWRYAPHLAGLSQPPYLEEPLVGSSYTATSLAALRALLVDADDALVFLSVPLGSERRLADPTELDRAGTPAYVASTPTNVALLPWRTNTAYAAVPSMRDNWVPDEAPAVILGGAAPFVFAFPPDPPPEVDGVDEVFAKTVRLFQYGLLDNAAFPNGNQNSVGLTQLRHEAPRRFVVRGTGIITGAVLRLHVPYPNPGYSGNPATDPNIRTVPIDLPLHPTDRTESGQQVWETAVELEPFWVYGLMLGGPRGQGVQDTIDYVIGSEMEEMPLVVSLGWNILGFGTIPAPSPIVEPQGTATQFDNPFDPDGWNWFRIEVINPTGSSAQATGQRLVF